MNADFYTVGSYGVQNATFRQARYKSWRQKTLAMSKIHDFVSYRLQINIS